MRRNLLHFLALFVVTFTVADPGLRAEEASGLRLVPFPKEVRLEPGLFPLKRRLVLEVSQGQAELLGEQISAELRLAAYAAPTVRTLKADSPVLRLSTEAPRSMPSLPVREATNREAYALQ